MKKEKNKKRRENQTWSLTKKILGIILIIIGIFGLFLPFLQGILLILLGLTLYHNRGIKEVARRVIKKFKRGERNPIKLALL